MLSEKGVFVATDRLGSVRATSSGDSLSYFPWGEERGTGTADGRTKFAGYYRDQPGQDYANYRYYSATTGSFWSPDPAGAGAADTGYGSGMAASYIPGFGAAHPDAPLSWNRYLYSLGDPINLFDPIGKYACDPDVDDSCEDEPDCGDSLSPCPADPDEGGGDGDCTVQSDGTVTCPGMTVTVSAPPIPVTTGLAPTPGIMSTIGGVITQVGSVAGAIAGIFLFPVSNDGCDTLDCPGAPGYQGARKKNNWSDPQWVEMNCKEVGSPVIVPSTSFPGGLSVEQEYVCPDGNTYSIHTLRTPSGKPGDRHVRPGKPKHGGGQ